MCKLATREQIDELNHLFSSMPDMTPEEQDNQNEAMQKRVPIYEAIPTQCHGKMCGGTCGISIPTFIHECYVYHSTKQWDELRFRYDDWKRWMKQDQLYFVSHKKKEREWSCFPWKSDVSNINLF